MQSWESYRQKAENELEAEKQQRIAESNAAYDKQKSSAEETYNKAVTDTERSYDEVYDENAVQKLINQRAIAENMANSGLSDSGLSKANQSAAERTYIEGRKTADRKLKAAVDSLASQLADTISSIEQNRSAAEGSIKESYSQQAWNNAASLYKSDLNAETEKQKAAYELTARVQAAQQSAKKYHGLSLTEYDKIMDAFDHKRLPDAKNYIKRYSLNLTESEADYWANYYLKRQYEIMGQRKLAGYDPDSKLMERKGGK